MSYDILTIALILYYAVMFVFAILYLNDWPCYLLGLGNIKKTQIRAILPVCITEYVTLRFLSYLMSSLSECPLKIK